MIKIIDQEIARKDRDYVSFSELHLFSSCPYKHHKNYNLKERESFTFYTAFGTALHEAIEQKWKYKNDLAWLKMGKIVFLIAKFFKDEDGKFSGKTPKEWVKSAFRIYDDFFVFIREEFPDYELYDIEMELDEDIEGCSRRFKGYIDIIMYNPKKDKYLIVDLKTSGWGWNKDQLSDTKKLYQVILYKNFFCLKMNIDPKKVDTCYILLLRNPAKKKRLAIDIHPTTSGTKKVSNAVNWMIDTVKLIEKGIKLKTPSTCSFCVCEKSLVKKRR